MKAVLRTLPVMFAFLLFAFAGCDRTSNILDNGAGDGAARVTGGSDGHDNDGFGEACSREVIPLFAYVRQDDTVVMQVNQDERGRHRKVCVGAVIVSNNNRRAKVEVKAYDGWYLGGLAIHLARELRCIPKWDHDGWRYDRFLIKELFRRPEKDFTKYINLGTCCDDHDGHDGHGDPDGHGGPGGWEGDRNEGLMGLDGIEDAEAVSLQTVTLGDWGNDERREDGCDRCGLRVGKVGYIAGAVTVIRRVGGPPPTMNENVLADAGTMDVTLQSVPPNGHGGIQFALVTIGDRSCGRNQDYERILVKRCPKIERGCYTTADQGQWSKPGSNLRNPAGIWRDEKFARAFPRGLVVGDDKWVKLTCARAVTDLLPIGGTLGKLRNCYIDPDGVTEERVERETGSLLAQVIALGLNLKWDRWVRRDCDCEVALADLVVTRGPFCGWRVWQVYAEANKILGNGRCRYTPGQINSALIAINGNFQGGCRDFLAYPAIDW